MPNRMNIQKSEAPPQPLTPSLESRIVRLEAIAALLVRHIRGPDVMSDEELVRIERDLQG